MLVVKQKRLDNIYQLKKVQPKHGILSQLPPIQKLVIIPMLIIGPQSRKTMFTKSLEYQEKYHFDENPSGSSIGYQVEIVTSMESQKCAFEEKSKKRNKLFTALITNGSTGIQMEERFHPVVSCFGRRDFLHISIDTCSRI